MVEMSRRRFLEVGAVVPGAAVAAQIKPADTSRDDRVVRLTGDGLGLTSAQYAHVLARIVDEKGTAPDSYILGGVVEDLEQQFARILGKERAVFMPTGTLANQLAIRALAGGSSRAVVQADSHIYQDSGDCVPTLANITLMPLAPGRATFTAAELTQLLEQTRGGRVASRVSVISIETPVRRGTGRIFDPAEMDKVVAVAGREGIKLHLDGARLFIQAAYARKKISEYTGPFDTVYVSLYKYFNAAAGAILAGPRSLLDEIYHVRRMYGGGLYQAWPYAAVALHYLQGFEDRFARAIAISEDWIRGMSNINGLSVERIESGTNLFRLRVTRGDPAAIQQRLASRNIQAGNPNNGTFLIAVNETLLRSTAAELTDAFRAAMG
jgi:threonine aldolase